MAFEGKKRPAPRRPEGKRRKGRLRLRRPMGGPLVLVNLKTYGDATGAAGLELCRSLQRADDGRSLTALAVPALDVARYAAALRLPIYAQHVDGAMAGKSTGHTVATAMAAAGAVGTLLNHAERPLAAADLLAAHHAAKGAGLRTVICAADGPKAAKVARLHPDYVAIEPPELIGGEVSVSTAAPEVVRSAVALVAASSPSVAVLCGAGIKDRADVTAARKLGTAGVLVASGVVCAKDPAAALSDLLAGMGR